MNDARAHVAALQALTRENASGEFIAVARDLEVHVFLQRGRIAWGTSSSNPFGFAKNLFNHCDLDKDSFRDLVETCRRDKKPLGETLIGWGLATIDQVRSALKTQVLETLSCLAAQSDPKTLFLARGKFADYDSRLTFALDDLLPSLPDLMSIDPAPLTQPVSGNSRSKREELTDAFLRIKADVPETLWVELVDALGVSTREPAVTKIESLGARLRPLLLEEKIDFVALRTPSGVVLGGTTADGQESLWCGLSAGATIGSALSALSRMLDADLSMAASPRHDLSSRWRSQGDSRAFERAGTTIAQTPEVIGVLELTRGGEVRWSNLRECLDPDRSAASALRCAKALELQVDQGQAGDSRALDMGTLGFTYGSMVVGHERSWQYTAQIPDASGRSLWLAVDRSLSQGLGWALLSSLVRVATAEGPE